MRAKPRLDRDDGTERRPTPERTQRVLRSVADLVGRKWHPVILDCLNGRGPMGFTALEEAIDDVSSKMLSESLKELEETHGIVDRTVVSDRPLRVEYSLTERGERLGAIVGDLREWGHEHLDEGVGRTAAPDHR